MTDLEKIKMLAKKLGVKAVEEKEEFEYYYDDANIHYQKENSSVKRLNIKNHDLRNDLGLICELTSLNILLLMNANLKNISKIQSLTQLTELDLSYNKISVISAIQNLERLSLLNLSYNQISNITPIKNLNQLNVLFLNNNNISDITPIQNLAQLTELNLSDNQISDITPIQNLKRSLWIELSKNKIEKLPPEFCDFHLDLEKIGLLDNPLQSPPPEIVKQGKEAMRRWFEAQAEGKLEELNEVKVILIGDAETGKTSLLSKLLKNEVEADLNKTEGINIEKFAFKYFETFSNYKNLHDTNAYFWDFGGQEIMFSTHQFFLTKRSIYILMLNARNDDEAENKVRRWMRKIESFTGSSGIIIVANKIDLNPSFDLAIETLKYEFPQIIDFVKLSCTDNNYSEGVENLKSILEEYIPITELYKTSVNKEWLPVKEKLQKKAKENHYLTKDEFKDICNELDNDNINDLKTFLHDLGILLHYTDFHLDDYHILNPSWVTIGVYKLINSEAIASNKGLLELDKLEEYINKDYKFKQFSSLEDNKIIYSRAGAECIVNILVKFNLAFFTDNKKALLIPDLLPKEVTTNHEKIFKENENNLTIVCKYEYLPNSVIHKLMVMAQYNIIEKWRTGFITESKGDINARALVFTKENCLTLIVTGRDKGLRIPDFLMQLETINTALKLNPEILRPLPGTTNEFVNYKHLLNLKKNGFENYPGSNPEITYPINDLLDGIPIATVERSYIKDNKKSKDIKIFLASSNELENERLKFSDMIRKMNDTIRNKDIYLLIEHWENFDDTISQIGKQNDYNEAIKECDLLVMLYWTKVGKYTLEEYKTAFNKFKETDRPNILVYQKTQQVDYNSISADDLISMGHFKKEMERIKHFETKIKNFAELEVHFRDQLKILLPKLVPGYKA